MRWTWNTTDEGRAKRAKSLKIDSIEIFDDGCTGKFTGSKGDVYTASLESCTCPDFVIKQGKIPCKHIIRLGMEAGLINQNGNTPEQQLTADIKELRHKIAIAAGYFHVFHESIITDDEYAQLKSKLNFLLNLAGKPIVEQPPSKSIAKDHHASEKNLSSIAEAILYLEKHDLEYIDKTSSGGALWFFDLNAAREFKTNGIKVNYSATGSRSNGKRPGWYIRGDQK